MKRFLRSRMGIATITIIGLLILIFFQRIGAVRPIENVITTAFKPVQQFLITISEKTKGVADYFQSVKKLKSENEVLRNSVAELSVENLSLKQNISDNELINEELEFITSHDYQSVTAKIIGRSSDEYLQVVIINKGDSVGIQKGFPVVSDKGILVGKIIDTNSNISKILLLNDNQSEVSAIIQNNDKSPGIISGQYGISLNMELIPQGDLIEKNQLVTTSGLEESIPPDLVIGSINDSSKRPGELFQEATIEPLVDYKNLSIVTVILPFND